MKPNTRRTKVRCAASRDAGVNDVAVRDQLDEPALTSRVNLPRGDVYAAVTQRITDLLRQGTVPWRQPWARITPQNLVSGKAYRGINPFLLACTGHGSPFWLTYRQAKALGGHVVKGEKATRVVFWKVYEREHTTPEGDVETRRYPLLRAYSVFNLEQCADIPDNKIPQIEATVFEPVAEAERIVTRMRDPPRIQHGATAAYYRPSTDTIHLPHRRYFQPGEAYYATLFHELTHSTGHAKRLDRGLSKKPPRFGSPDYSEEELVAEMGAAFLCSHARLTPATVDNSASYINGWLQRLSNDHKLVVIAAAKAQKAADYILGDQSEPSD